MIRWSSIRAVTWWPRQLTNASRPRSKGEPPVKMAVAVRLHSMIAFWLDRMLGSTLMLWQQLFKAVDKPAAKKLINDMPHAYG